MKRPVEDGISVLVGAGLGLALMYLLDPEVGSQRRSTIEKAARDRLAKAADAATAGVDYLHEAVDKVVDKATHSPTVQQLAAHAADAARAVYSDVSGKAAVTASDYQKQATDVADSFKAKVSSKLDEIRGRANDLKDSAQSNYGAWLNKTSKTLGRDEDHHYIGQTACALGSLALGAGAVYLFDPELGQKRRSQLIGTSIGVVRETGDFFRKTGRRLASVGGSAARGVIDRAQQVVSRAGLNPQTPLADDSTPEPANESNEASMGT